MDGLVDGWMDGWMDGCVVSQQGARKIGRDGGNRNTCRWINGYSAIQYNTLLCFCFTSTVNIYGHVGTIT